MPTTDDKAKMIATIQKVVIGAAIAIAVAVASYFGLRVPTGLAPPVPEVSAGVDAGSVP